MAGASSAQAAPLSAAPNDGEWLFVEQAKHATLHEAHGSGKLELTLIQPSPTVQAFTDRPARRFDVEPLSRFVTEWPVHFGHVPPNAAIEVAGASAAHDTLLVELLHPRFDRKGRLSYRVRPLRNSKRASDLRYFQRRADRRLPVRLGRTSLFIDDADDSSVQLAIGFASSSSDWLGSFGVSNATLPGLSAHGSIAFQANPSGFTLETLVSAEGTVFLHVNPLGQCVPVTFENVQGAAGSLTAAVGNNPGMPLVSGTNEVPVGSGSCG